MTYEPKILRLDSGKGFGRNLEQWRFESWHDFVAYTDTEEKSKHGHNSSRKERDASWAGTKDFPSAVKILKSGYPGVREKIDRIASVFAAANKYEAAPSFEMDVAGEYPIAAIAAAGDPASMVAPYPIESKSSPVIRLLVNSWFSAGYSQDDITNFGAALLSYIDAMENCGIRFELETIQSWSRPMGGSSFRVPIKRADEQMEVDRLAFCFAHPSMFRRIGFHVMERMKFNNSSNYGSPRSPKPKIEIDEDQTYLHGIQQIPYGSDTLRSPAKILKEIDRDIRNSLATAGADIPWIWSDDFITCPETGQIIGMKED